ncbi:MAG: hypothetical protein WCI20_03510 [bacterium]
MDSETEPRTMGAAAFLIPDSGDEGNFAGGVSCAVELADGAIGAGCGTGDGIIGGVGAGVVVTSGEDGCAGADEEVPDLATGMDAPHFGHLIDAGIREGEALIFNLALQLPHSMGIRSITLSLPIGINQGLINDKMRLPSQHKWRE